MSNSSNINKENHKCKLQKLLEEKNITQTELSYMISKSFKTGLGKDAINRIIKGKKQNYHIFTLLKICYVLDCTPNDIIEREQFTNEFLVHTDIDIA